MPMRKFNQVEPLTKCDSVCAAFLYYLQDSITNRVISI